MRRLQKSIVILSALILAGGMGMPGQVQAAKTEGQKAVTVQKTSKSRKARRKRSSKRIRLSKKKVVLYTGDKAILKVKGTKKKVRYLSKNKAVATVTKKGVIKGRNVGRTTIIAKVASRKLRCKVVVKRMPSPAEYIARTKQYLLKSGLKGDHNDRYMMATYQKEDGSSYVVTIESTLQADGNLGDLLLTYSDSNGYLSAKYCMPQTPYVPMEYQGSVAGGSGKAVGVVRADQISPKSYLRMAFSTQAGRPDFSQLANQQNASLKEAMAGWDQLLEAHVSFGIRQLGFRNWE
ncbi:MAG: Ig-like domain-containing protein [Lachnospiraceae bacterium]|nr:Ig-like domain-containing protein [Lachnospiraceae bacterium]